MGIKIKHMKYIKKVILEVENDGYNRIREQSYSDGRRSVELELWKGDDFPDFGRSKWGAPHGYSYRIPGWHQHYCDAVNACEAHGYPKTYYDQFDRDAVSSLAEAISKGIAPEKWADRMSYYYKEYFSFRRK